MAFSVDSSPMPSDPSVGRSTIVRKRFRSAGSAAIASACAGVSSSRPITVTSRPAMVSTTVVRCGSPSSRFQAADGQTLTVVVAHPLPGTIDSAAGDLVPIGYDATSRDRQLAQVRAVVDPILAAGEPLLLIGDLNVVDREPGYDTIAHGLTDAQRAVALGPGSTWRPDRLKGLPFGLLRIDYLFSANGVAPVSVGPDCTPRGSDHCLLAGTMALP